MSNSNAFNKTRFNDVLITSSLSTSTDRPTTQTTDQLPWTTIIIVLGFFMLMIIILIIYCLTHRKSTIFIQSRKTPSLRKHRSTTSKNNEAKIFPSQQEATSKWIQPQKASATFTKPATSGVTGVLSSGKSVHDKIVSSFYEPRAMTRKSRHSIFSEIQNFPATQTSISVQRTNTDHVDVERLGTMNAVSVIQDKFYLPGNCNILTSPAIAKNEITPVNQFVGSIGQPTQNLAVQSNQEFTIDGRGLSRNRSLQVENQVLQHQPVSAAQRFTAIGSVGKGAILNEYNFPILEKSTPVEVLLNCQEVRRISYNLAPVKLMHGSSNPQNMVAMARYAGNYITFTQPGFEPLQHILPTDVVTISKNPVTSSKFTENEVLLEKQLTAPERKPVEKVSLIKAQSVGSLSKLTNQPRSSFPQAAVTKETTCEGEPMTKPEKYVKKTTVFNSENFAVIKNDAVAVHRLKDTSLLKLQQSVERIESQASENFKTIQMNASPTKDLVEQNIDVDFDSSTKLVYKPLARQVEQDLMPVDSATKKGYGSNQQLKEASKITLQLVQASKRATNCYQIDEKEDKTLKVKPAKADSLSSHVDHVSMQKPRQTEIIDQKGMTIVNHVGSIQPTLKEPLLKDVNSLKLSSMDHVENQDESHATEFRMKNDRHEWFSDITETVYDADLDWRICDSKKRSRTKKTWRRKKKKILVPVPVLVKKKILKSKRKTTQQLATEEPTKELPQMLEKDEANNE